MNNFIRKHVKMIVVLFFTSTISIWGQSEDSVKTYWLSPVEITAKRISLAETNLDPSKDRLSSIFESNGFSLIRKGVFFAQDIYADGLKRSDITVVVDNERYHSACPNRMDSPLTRINPIETESVDLIKTNGDLLSGLGGVVNYHRVIPGQNMKLKTGLSGTAGSSKSIDAAVMFEGYSHSITARYSTGTPYENAEGNTFEDLYGYNDLYKYNLAEASFQGKQKDFRYGASFTYTEDVSFPYLLMDERTNRVVSSFLSYKNNKIYFNYTDHLMDNNMRESGMLMETKAKNLTVGLVGTFYEVYYRNWDSENKFRNMMTNIDNHLMPDVKTFSLMLQQNFTFDKINLSGKAGIINQSMNDSERESFFNKYFEVDKFSRWFPTFGLTLDYVNSINQEIGYGFLVEAFSESPDPEELYISVVKPMAKPNWVGNPNLDQPLRAALRGMIADGYANLELFYTRIWNYAYLTNAEYDKKIMTYKNINAELMGANFSFNWQYVDLALSYTYAQNLSTNSPLAEIRPFEANLKLRAPKFYGVEPFLEMVYNTEQTRIDESLQEHSTSAWYRADLGIRYNHESFSINLTLENITNQLFYRHLSYLRDPFSAGVNVFEPGRNLYLSVSYLY